MEKTLEELTKRYKEFAIIKSIRENTGQKTESVAKKLGISNELYQCFERDEIAFQILPERAKERISLLTNVYYQTFRLNRQDAFNMWQVSSGMNKDFFIKKFEISERTFYSYLAGENINKAKEIDDYLLIN